MSGKNAYILLVASGHFLRHFCMCIFSTFNIQTGVSQLKQNTGGFSLWNYFICVSKASAWMAWSLNQCKVQAIKVKHIFQDNTHTWHVILLKVLIFETPPPPAPNRTTPKHCTPWRLPDDPLFVFTMCRPNSSHTVRMVKVCTTDHEEISPGEENLKAGPKFKSLLRLKGRVYNFFNSWRLLSLSRHIQWYNVWPILILWHCPFK